MPEEGLGFHLPSLIAYGVNFLLLLGVLYLAGYKPILRMLSERQGRIQESLETAERVRQEATEQREELQRQLDASRQEGQRIMTEARDAADRFRQEEMQRARQEAEAFLARAQGEIRRERDSAVEEVRRYFADLAILAAERVIQRSLDQSAHREVIQRVLEESGNFQQR